MTLISYFQTCMWTWDQSRVKTKNRGCGRYKSMRLEKNVALQSVPLLWCYWWSWTLADSSPLSAVCRLHFPSPRLSFCNWFPAFLAQPVHEFSFLFSYQSCNNTGEKDGSLFGHPGCTRVQKLVQIVEIKGKQWLNLSDHVVIDIHLARRPLVAS